MGLSIVDVALGRTDGLLVTSRRGGARPEPRRMSGRQAGSLDGRAGSLAEDRLAAAQTGARPTRLRPTSVAAAVFEPQGLSGVNARGLAASGRNLLRFRVGGGRFLPVLQRRKDAE